MADDLTRAAPGQHVNVRARTAPGMARWDGYRAIAFRIRFAPSLTGNSVLARAFSAAS
jgi:hypothetical protein